MCSISTSIFSHPRWRAFFNKLYLPFRVYLISEARHLRREESSAGALSTRVKETRSVSQKIKHLYSAEIFQRRLDSFLISFMAGRNITRDLLLLSPTAATTTTITVLVLARARHSRSSRFAPLLSSLRGGSLT